MQRAWLILLAACGFRSGVSADDAGARDASGSDTGPTGDAMADAASPDGGAAFCWAIADTSIGFQISACPTALVPSIDINVDAVIDTDTTVSPPGVGCAPLASGSFPVCALAANAITIGPGATLFAHGSRPLALLGHAITILGTVDVASHVAGQIGPASDPTGCLRGDPADNDGGGQGGTLDGTPGKGVGGKGGDQEGPVGVGGKPGTAISLSRLRGGCPGEGGGGRGASAPGGGAVWIARDAGTLVLGGSAVINASGVGGPGGTLVGSHGGGGGGSGGMIVLQAPLITLGDNTAIFANGGGGGGGASGLVIGHPGGDPSLIAGGAGGGNGTSSSGHPGNGGSGFPQVTNGGDGVGAGTGNAGGGGGGGEGAILVASGTTLDPARVSPPVKVLSH